MAAAPAFSKQYAQECAKTILGTNKEEQNKTIIKKKDKVFLK